MPAFHLSPFSFLSSSSGVVSVMSGEKEGWTRNGSEKETSSLTWTGHNEEVASSLGEGWTGFGVSLDE